MIMDDISKQLALIGGGDVRDDSDFSMWRLDINEIAIELEHDLKGEYWDPEHVDNKIPNQKGGWVKRGTALLNDDGVKTVTSIIKSVVNRNLILSKFDDTDIREIRLELNIAMSTNLFFNHEPFKIKKSHLSIITNKVDKIIFAALKRAEEGGEREHLHKSEKVIRTYAEGDKRGGVRMPPLFKGRGGSE